MIRWQTLTLCLAVVALVACGGTTAVAPPQRLAEATSSGPVGAAPPRSNAAVPTAVTATAAAPRSASPATLTVAVPRSAVPSTAPSTAPTVASSAAPRSSAPTPASTSGSVAGTPPAGLTAVPQPSGAVPAGWRIYRGPVYFPFAIAYPPDWTLDDSLLPEQRVITLYGPNRGATDEEISIELRQTATGANIDVQRDEFFYARADFCVERGIEYTTRRPLSGVPFALLGATCEAGNALTFMQVALGLNGGDEWSVMMRTPYEHRDARLREVFDPMLASLNIYARVPE